MHKYRAFNLVEVLVVIAIFLVVIVLSFLMVFFASKGARDVKRISDIDALRSSMASIKVQYGSYLEAGCKPGAVYECMGGNLEKVLPTIYNFKDSRGVKICSENCQESCQYSFSRELTENSFEVLFYLEKGLGNYPEKGCYVLTERGIAKR